MKVFVVLGEQYKTEIEGVFIKEKDAYIKKKRLEKIYPKKYFHVEEYYVQEEE